MNKDALWKYINPFAEEEYNAKVIILLFSSFEVISKKKNFDNSQNFHSILRRKIN